MSRQSVPARVKHQHGLLLACPAPQHDFQPAIGPEGSTVARCAACGSTVSRAAGQFYRYGVRDALASVSRAARVREAEAEMATERADRHQREKLRARAGVPAGDADDDDDDVPAADAEVLDDASR